MIRQNENNEDAVLYIYLKKDMDVSPLEYEVDGVTQTMLLSNKGCYAVLLGPFHSLFIPDNENIEVKLQKKQLKIENFDFIKGASQAYQIQKNKSYLFEDLKEENGDSLYRSIKRLQEMTFYYLQTKEKEVLEGIQYGLDFIFRHWYTGQKNYTGNWWNYEIGTPRILNEILCLLIQDIGYSKILSYLNVENFYIPDAQYIFYRRNYPSVQREKATYANLSDNIYICLLRAILQNDDQGMRYLFEMLAQVLALTKQKDGFYEDGSFIQHQNIPYNASYGEVLLHSISKVMVLFSKLNFDCTAYLNQIYTYAVTTYAPVLYHRMALNSVRGRAQSRSVQDSYYSAKTILNALKTIESIQPSTILRELIENEERNFCYPAKAYAFNAMDRFIKRNQDYLLVISANSLDVANYECINGENLLGYYSSNFCYDLYKNHQEYKDEIIKINPFYRNGSTNSFKVEAPNEIISGNQAAGVTLGEYLATSFFQNSDVQGQFSKFVLQHSFVCVGSKIQSESSYISTIAQSQEEIKQENGNYHFGEITIQTADPVVLKCFEEQRSYYDLNQNESKQIFQFKTNRLFLENPSHYHYQISPKSEKLEEYQLSIQDNAHILQYKNLLFISIFLDTVLEMEDIRIQGCSSVIIEYQQNEIWMRFSTGTRKTKTIHIQIKDHQCYATDLKRKNEVSDEYEHWMKFRRTDEAY